MAAAYEGIKKRAGAGWQELGKNGPVIMVGTATCGRAAGALEVLHAFRDEVKKHHLDCPVIEVGCLGHCYAEPLAIIGRQDAMPHGHLLRSIPSPVAVTSPTLTTTPACLEAKKLPKV